MPDFFKERTVRWADGCVILIDQTKLPNKMTYVRCMDARDITDAIRNMVVRGAPAIGAAAAMGIALTACHSKSRNRKSLLSELITAANMLKSTRPTGVNLFWGIERVLEKAKRIDGSPDDIRDGIIAEAIEICDEDVSFNKEIGLHGADLLEDGETVLTHCK